MKVEAWLRKAILYKYWHKKEWFFHFSTSMASKITALEINCTKILSQTLTFMQNWNVLMQSFNIWKRCFTLMAHKFLKLNRFFLIGQIIHLKLKQVHFYRKSLQKTCKKSKDSWFHLAWLCWALTAGQICFWLSVISWKLKLYRKICQAS